MKLISKSIFFFYFLFFSNQSFTQNAFSHIEGTQTSGGGTTICLGAHWTLKGWSDALNPCGGAITKKITGPNGFVQNNYVGGQITMPDMNASLQGIYTYTVSCNATVIATATWNCVMSNSLYTTSFATATNPVCEGAIVVFSQTTTPVDPSPLSMSTYWYPNGTMVVGPTGGAASSTHPLVSSETGVYTCKRYGGDGCITPCSNTINITINPKPYIASLSIVATPSETPCAGETVTLNQSIGFGCTYLWSGPNGFTSTLTSPTIPNFQIINNGTYSLRSKKTATGCISDPNTINITTTPLPVVASAITVNDNTPCVGSTLNLNSSLVAGSTYAWSGPNGFTSTLQNPTIANIQTTGTGTYSLVITNTATGCSSIASANSSIVVTVQTLPVVASAITVNDNTPCVGSTLNLNSSLVAGSTYAWSGPNGFTSTLQNPTIANIQTTGTGTYSLVITNTATGCSSIASANSSIVVTVQTLPVIASAVTVNDNTPCVGTTLILNAPFVAGCVYAWGSTEGWSGIGQNPTIPNIQVTETATYSLVLIDNATGCFSVSSANSSVAVTVETLPVVSSAVTVNNTTPCVGTTLNLGSSLIAGSTYAWSGPNGFTSTLQNPTIANIQVAGTGTYSLVVTNTATGCSSVSSSNSSIAVTVETLPVVSSAVTVNNTTPCVGTTLNLGSSLIAGSTYAWSGPNGFTSTLQNPTIANIQVAGTGTYSLVVTNTATGCSSVSSSNSSIAVVVNTVPVVSSAVTVNSTTPCVGTTLNLGSSLVAGSTYAWSGPNGFTSTLQNPTISNIQVAGTGTYSLVVTDVVTTCSSVLDVNSSVPVIVNALPVFSSIVLLSDPSPCVNSFVDFSAPFIAGSTYAWSGPNGFTSTLQNPTITNIQVAGTGTYSLIVTNTTTGCSSVTDVNSLVNLTVVLAPVITNGITVNDSTPCVGTTLSLGSSFISGITYAWSGPNGFTSTLQNPTIANIQIAGTGIYLLTIIDNNTGCSSVVSANSSVGVNVIALPVISSAVIVNSTTPCVGTTLSLGSEFVAGSTYVWSGPNGFTSTLQNPSISNIQVTGTGTYSLIITNTATGCSSVASANSSIGVVVSLIPIITFNDTFIVCNQPYYNLSVGNYDSYVWSNGNTSNSINITNSGYYSLYVIDNTCISNVDSIYINMFNDSLYFNKSGKGCLKESFDFSVLGINGASTYLWSGPNGFSSNTSSNNLLSVEEFNLGSYNVAVDFHNGCFDTISFELTVFDKSICQEIPEIITPNNDNDNEAFLIKWLEQYPDNNIKIFNRWGVEIFFAAPYKNDFNGVINGNKLPSGSYYYLLDINNGLSPIKGILEIQY